MRYSAHPTGAVETSTREHGSSGERALPTTREPVGRPPASPAREDERSGLGRLWSDGDSRDLIVSQTISSLGDWVATVALMVLILELTDSSAAVGGILVVRLAPAVVAGPVATRLVVRWSRLHAMLAMDVARAAVVAVIPFVGAVWWVYTWAFVLELCGLIFLPARDSSIPDIVGDRDLSLANSVVLGTSYGTIPLGAGLFALVAWAGGKWLGNDRIGTSIALWFNAATFVVSFMILSNLRAPALRRRGSERHGPETTTRKTGFMAAIRLPFVRTIAYATVAVAIGLGSLFSLGIVFVRSVLYASDTGFAALIAMFGVGAAIGMVGISRVRSPDLRVTRLLIATQGIVVATMAFSPNVEIALAGAVAFGAATAAALAAAMSVVQVSLDGDERELAFTAFHVLIRFGLAISALGAGLAADLVRSIDWPIVGSAPPARIVLGCSGAMVFVVALVSGRSTAWRARGPTAEDASERDGARSATGPAPGRARLARRVAAWTLASGCLASLGRVAALGAALAYAWWAMSLEPVTWIIRAAVLVPGIALVVVGTRVFPDGERDTSSRVRSTIAHIRRVPPHLRLPSKRTFIVGLMTWGVVIAAITAFQLFNFVSWPRFDHPTISSMINAFDSSRPVRVAVFIAWFMFGWDLVKR